MSYSMQTAPIHSGAMPGRPAYPPSYPTAYPPAYPGGYGGNRMMPYGQPYVPTMPAMSWMPVVRTVPAATDAFQPEALKTTETSQAVESLGEKGLGEKRLEETGLDEKSAAAQPQTYPEEVGQKVGQLVTDVLEKNPEWQAKLQEMNLETMLQDPDSSLARIRDSVQQSRLFKLFPKRFDKRIAGMFPAEMEPTVQQVLTWLRAQPSEGLQPEGLLTQA